MRRLGARCSPRAHRAHVTPLAFGVAWRPGSGLIEKHGNITNVHACHQRTLIAAQVAKYLRLFESCLFVVGEHADLYGMPPEFGGHVADIRLSLDIVGVLTTDDRRMAQAMHRHEAGARHTNCCDPSQWALCHAIAELIVTTALQVRWRDVVAINVLFGRRTRTDEMYGYDVAWHIEREFSGHDARLAMVASSTPSVLGPRYS